MIKLAYFMKNMLCLFCVEGDKVMDSNDEKFLILEQYRIYTDAKEKFIDRQFATNRFYLVLNIILLVTTYVLSTLTPQYQPVIVLSVIGIAITLMWWMNIDTYQMLIKVKYANVLEYLETKLPEQPNHKEFVDYSEMKHKKGVIVFGDFQKILALAITSVYCIVCAYSITNLVKYTMM